jgi:hypothetical protein
MNQELREDDAPVIEKEFAGVTRQKRNSGAVSLGKGFVEGFGSVGYVFRAPRSFSRKGSLAFQMAKVPSGDRKAVATQAKRKLVAKYVGKAMASKMCSVSKEGAGRRVDASMIYRDFATALSKTHGR